MTQHSAEVNSLPLIQPVVILNVITVLTVFCRILTLRMWHENARGEREEKGQKWSGAECEHVVMV